MASTETHLGRRNHSSGRRNPSRGCRRNPSLGCASAGVSSAALAVASPFLGWFLPEIIFLLWRERSDDGEVACACSALARHCARSLWGRGPALVLLTRARAAPNWRHSLHALWKGTARAGGRRSFGARHVLPRGSPAPHRARRLARVARLRATALALLSGDEAQHVRFRCAR